MLHLLAFIVLICVQLTSMSKHCYERDGSCSEEVTNLYKEEYSEYFKYYQKANAEYTPQEINCYNATIAKELSPFKNGITTEMLNAALNHGVRYQLIKGQLFRSAECTFPSRCAGVEHFIKLLKAELPDFDVVINMFDWPHAPKNHGRSLPVLSFSKTDDYYDILYPAWTFWSGGPAIKIYPKGLGRWDLHRMSMMEMAKKWPWDKKLKVFFFRGSRTSSERDAVVLISRKNPELVNASYTANQAWRSNEDTLGEPPTNEVSLEEHCMYRYLFNFRGVTASFRFKYLFLCKSLVLHVGDEWREFFYNELKPWVHYIPIKRNSSEEEYRKLLGFIIQEDKVAKKIAENGFEFIKRNLRMDDIRCYWKHLLTEYSRLLKFKPILEKSLVQV